MKPSAATIAPMIGRAAEEEPPGVGANVVGLADAVAETLPDGLGDLCGLGEWLGDPLAEALGDAFWTRVSACAVLLLGTGSGDDAETLTEVASWSAPSLFHHKFHDRGDAGTHVAQRTVEAAQREGAIALARVA